MENPFLEKQKILLMNNSTDVFYIVYQSLEIRLDGIIDSTEWDEATVISSLKSPWAFDRKNHTVFRCFFSDHYFNFSFNVIDKDIKVINNSDKHTVAEGDRVELFLSPTPTLDTYYCLEIAPNGKVLDYKAKFYRKFDTTWCFKGCEVASKLTDKGYAIEGRLPITEMKKLHLDLQKGFHMGVYRADCMSLGDSFDWYTWIDPLNKTPDFHVPASFQLCRIRDKHN